MAEEHAAEDRTEGATARRLEQAREAGQLPISRDLATLASLAGGVGGIVALAPAPMRQLAAHCADLVGQVDRVRLDGAGGGAVGGVLLSALLLVGAVALPAAASGVGAVLLQTQFHLGRTPVRFDFGRLSPRAGFGRIVSGRNALDWLKSCARLAILGLLAWWVLSRAPAAVLATIGADPGALLPAVRDGVAAVVRPLLLVLAAFAVADVFLVRFGHARSLRMTKEQVRLETRDTEGDPVIKARVRRIRQQRARRRMMAKVRTADVVVTNPTHYAVALLYDRNGGGAPRVVAKGVDFVAARIRAEADAHQVPIVPSPPLARALYAVELDHEIPFEHYRAVAEVIAFVWRLGARRTTAPHQPEQLP